MVSIRLGYGRRPTTGKYSVAWIAGIVWGFFNVMIASAQEEAKSAEGPPKKWSGDMGLSVVSSYYAYGILQEKNGVIVQPFADLSYAFFESDGFLTKASVGLQLWGSVHSKQTEATVRNNLRSYWYEQDVVLPFGLTFSESWTLTVSYLEYHFPNGALDRERSFSANLSYDDTKILGAFALHPHIIALYNFEGEVGLGQSNAWYFEAGISPGTVLASKSPHPVTLTFPVILGMGDNHFYPGNRFGYLSFAATASVPIGGNPAAGSWSVNFGVTRQILGSSTAQLNDGGHSVGGQAGIRWEF